MIWVRKLSFGALLSGLGPLLSRALLYGLLPLHFCMVVTLDILHLRTRFTHLHIVDFRS